MWFGSRPRWVPSPLPMQTSPVGRQEGSDPGTRQWRRPRAHVRRLSASSDPAAATGGYLRRSGWPPDRVGVRLAADRGPAVGGDPRWADVGRRPSWPPRLHRRLPLGRSLSASPASVTAIGWRSLPRRPPPCRPRASLPMSMSDTAERPSSGGAAIGDDQGGGPDRRPPHGPPPRGPSSVAAVVDLERVGGDLEQGAADEGRPGGGSHGRRLQQPSRASRGATLPVITMNSRDTPPARPEPTSAEGHPGADVPPRVMPAGRPPPSPSARAAPMVSACVAADVDGPMAISGDSGCRGRPGRRPGSPWTTSQAAAVPFRHVAAVVDRRSWPADLPRSSHGGRR
jgi:hypothetical protein